MLSIGQFSKMAHDTTKSLRYYDQISLLKLAYLDEENGNRYYATSLLEDILFIQKLKEYDFSLKEIKEAITVENDQRGPQATNIVKQTSIFNLVTIQKRYTPIGKTLYRDVTLS